VNLNTNSQILGKYDSSDATLYYSTLLLLLLLLFRHVTSELSFCCDHRNIIENDKARVIHNDQCKRTALKHSNVI